MRRKYNDLAINQVGIPMAAFLENYNRNIPAGYPQASTKMLKQFQVAHPILFKHGDEWSVDKHRKKLMDWLSSSPNIV